MEERGIPTVFKEITPAPVLIAQGAEALLYKIHFLSPTGWAVLKFRPPKTWRHPILDARLTRHRILSEARILVKSRRSGVPVPSVLALDWEGRKTAAEGTEGGWMVMEWIEGDTVRAALSAYTHHHKNANPENPGLEGDQVVVQLMQRIGQVVGRLHSSGVIHGDLTTSNLMLRYPKRAATEPSSNPSLDGEVILIDFGLAVGGVAEEDRAVDLYVLERAFGSTHPTIEDHFEEVLDAYGNSYKGAKQVLRRLEDVRQRGRKKSMIG